ncbi:MAG: L-threonylcarbamoyladenylate synthase [Saprospiraceae bacterium]
MFENDKLEDIIDVLKTSGLILYPTDTIWGIGCDACDEEAVRKVYQLKQSTHDENFVLLVDSLAMLKKYVAEVHPRIDTLLSYHIRPLTVVYEEAKDLAPSVIAPDGSIAVRIVQDDFCKNLIQAFGRPLVATSANIHNQAFPSNFGAISSEVIRQVDYVVKARQSEKSLQEPSVLVKVSPKGELVFLRE